MTPQDDARHALHEASADLEALRAQTNASIGSTTPEDEPILAAWSLALDRYRAACRKYVVALSDAS